MDSRQTLVVLDTFEQMLEELYKSNGKVALLYDDNGITRAEGYIREYISGENQKNMVLDSGATIAIKKIVAVNGVFLSDYSEC